MAEYLTQDTTLDAIADAINAKTGKSASMTPAEMVTEIESIETGTEITDGIVFTAFDVNGNPTAADIYGNLPQNAFGYYNNNDSYGKFITSIHFRGGTKVIKYGAFQKIAITDIVIPDSVNIIGAHAFRGNSALAHYTHENARGLYGYRAGAVSALYGLTSLQTMQLGAIGKPVTDFYYQAFTSIQAPSTAVFTIYCIGDNVDSFLASMRRSLTSQKIVFKASSETEYNGTTYAAGETILTSEVTS